MSRVRFYLQKTFSLPCGSYFLSLVPLGLCYAQQKVLKEGIVFCSVSLRSTYEMYKGLLRKIFLKEFIKSERLRKIRNIPLTAITIYICFFCVFRYMVFLNEHDESFIHFLRALLSELDESLVHYTMVTALTTLLFSLMIEELKIIFSNRVFDGNPRTPSRRDAFYLFVFSLMLLLSFPLAVYSLNEPHLVVLLLFLLCLLIFAGKLRMHGNIRFFLVGRVYTYFSPSTSFFLYVLFFMFTIFRNTLQSYELPDLGFPIDTELILFAAFVIPLTLLYFWTKERIFIHYGKVIISHKTEKYSRRKGFLEDTLKELLRSVPEVEEIDVDELYKRAYLIKLKIDDMSQEIKKVEKEFEFHGSLTLSLITQPFWLILIVEVIPRVVDLLRNFFSV